MLAVVLLLMGCRSGEAPATASATTGGAVTERIVLDVLRPDGELEQVYAIVGLPHDPGPHPVVVYAHGQGLPAAFNCAEGPPDDSVSDHAELVTLGLANEGWLTVTPLFRNRGDTAPLLGATRPRDHYLLDASAVLAAAQHGVAHPAGGGPVGLVGLSMGSFAVTWAGSSEPALDAAAAGLDLRVVVAGAMLGDHIGNLGRVHAALSHPEELGRAEAITQAVVGAVNAMAFPRGVDPITSAAHVDDLLTPRGTELAERGLLEAADPAWAPCEGLEGAPICSIDCFVELFYDVLGDEPLDPASFLEPVTLEALDHWALTDGADPGPSPTNPVLAALRSMSPAYGLPGARTARWASLLADNDRVVTELLAVGELPRERWLEALEATGAEVADLRVTESGCGHDDYLLPSYGECGFDLVRAELRAALE